LADARLRREVVMTRREVVENFITEVDGGVFGKARMIWCLDGGRI
jgi:hypothetical protein